MLTNEAGETTRYIMFFWNSTTSSTIVLYIIRKGATCCGLFVALKSKAKHTCVRAVMVHLDYCLC